MRYEILEFEKRVDDGYIRKSYQGDMVIYNYTDACTFARAWDAYTMVARGLVLHRHTGEIIAQCLPKFFNLGETEEMKLKNLPLHKGYHVFEKLDGSYGSVFWYDGQWRVTTRGAFESPQAVKAIELLRNYKIKFLDKKFTYVVEIIYPENKIVVDYGTQEKLVLLTAIHNPSGKEINPEIIGHVADQLGMESAMMFPYTIEEMISLQKTIPKDQEGWVIRFTNGLRVKIKGDEYMKISRILSGMSPLTLWETMKFGMVDRKYLAQLPEEFRKEYEPIAKKLEDQYHIISDEIEEDLEKLPTKSLADHETRRAVGLFVGTGQLKHPAAIFPTLKGHWEDTDIYIMKKIRPKNNELVNVG